jgi:hypothetical protein
MVEMQNALVQEGHEVFIPKNAEKYASGEFALENSRESTKNKIEGDLIREYYREIKDSDAVLIANFDKNGIKNYIGGNSFLEAAFAHVLNKKLYFLNDIPEMTYIDELRVFRPIILNGDLSRIQ